MRVIILLFFFLSCAPDRPLSNENHYFDTKTFFEGQIAQLSQRQVHLVKELLFNGKKELFSSDSINWKKELEAFVSVDLLKLSYRGRFNKDSINLNQEGYVIIYNANDKNVDLKSVKIYFDRSKAVRSIEYDMGKNNTIYESGKRLYFSVDSGYSISGRQNVKLTQGVIYQVNARAFLR
jgi:hypothetical protein